MMATRRKAAAARPTTEFLNVDLDLAGPSALNELVRALSPSLIVVHEEAGKVSLELAGQPEDPDRAIIEIARLVMSLRPDAQAIWRKCHSRRFSLGIQAGKGPHETRFPISQDAVSLVHELRADLVVTVY